MTLINSFSVVLPVFNGESHVSNAIKDLLNQEHMKFELILIDDGSTDNTSKVLAEFGDNKMIKLVSIAKNLGHSNALNVGISLATYNWIAIADADDRYPSNRLQLQSEYINQNPEIKLFGGHCKILGKNFGWPVYLHHSQILSGMIFRNQFVHPSLVFHREIIENEFQYNNDFRRANDYQFISRIVKQFKTGNSKNIFVNYNLNINPNTKDVQSQESAIVKKEWLNWMGINPSQSELNLHIELSDRDIKSSQRNKELAEWCLFLIEAAKKHNKLDARVFKSVLLNELKLNSPSVFKTLPLKLTLLNGLTLKK